ncbi:MAG: formylglycine-generating enzyme family protein [Gammaproteobacteria bacterium]|nr:formylglycine-generating enzyme family protein [Gammaproteobacteria bacterium]
MFSKTYLCKDCSEKVTSLENYNQDLKLCNSCVLETISRLKLQVLQLNIENKDLAQRCNDQNIPVEEKVCLTDFKTQQDTLLKQVKLNETHWASIPSGQLDGDKIAAFEMLSTPVTFEMFDIYCLKNEIKLPYDEGWGRESRPVIHVDYYQVQAYIEWLNQQTGWQCSLPTAEQWEYACRAGTITNFWYGDQSDSRMMVVDTTQTMPTPGKYPANPWGLYDMHGNVWEWTSSKNGSKYVLCGGSWYNKENWLTSSARNISFASGSYNNWGFRLMRAL